MSEEISVWKALWNAVKALWGVWKAKQTQDSKREQEASQEAAAKARETLQEVTNEIERLDAETPAAGEAEHDKLVRQCRELEGESE